MKRVAIAALAASLIAAPAHAKGSCTKGEHYNAAACARSLEAQMRAHDAAQAAYWSTFGAKFNAMAAEAKKEEREHPSPRVFVPDTLDDLSSRIDDVERRLKKVERRDATP
jgi:hypothetical protein